MAAAVFLSHINVPGMPLYPGEPEFSLTTAATVAKDGFYLQQMHIGEQSGTHWAAPSHFHADGASAEEVSPGDLIRPVVVVDVRRRAEEDPDFELGVADLEAFETAHGRIPDGAIAVMWTGFQDRWDDPGAYFNRDASGGLHYPGFGVSATSWLIERRRIGGLGIDTLGVDPGLDTEFRINRMLLHERRIHLENLAGLEEMPPNGGWVVVGGVRNQNGSGGPATVFGLIP
jgi:kynurenine formamidase